VSTNLELGGTLIMGTVNVEAQHSLEAVTATGNTTPLTIEFTNPTTSLVASGNVEVGGDVVLSGNIYNNANLSVQYTTIFPTWTQVGSDIDGEAAGDRFGYSVSMSSDGTRMAIGAPYNDGTASDAGHVRVYAESGGTWTQVGLDIDGEAAYDYSGYSVSMSSDGTRVAIGAPFNALFDRSPDSNAGHVRVYAESGGTWTQVGTDIDGEAAGDSFGQSVSMSSDGTRVAIGARMADDDAGNAVSHVRVYAESGGTWTQVGSDIDGEAAYDYFGWSVSMSSDGTRVAIGAYDNDGTGSSAGHVRVYAESGGTWTQVGSDIDGEAAYDYSGWSVSMSSDGTRVAIGAKYNDGNGSAAGHVRVYDWNGSQWSKVGSDIDGEAAGDESGFSVSISSDGTRVAIGAQSNDGTGDAAGHVRVYSESGGTWTQVGQDIDGESGGVTLPGSPAPSDRSGHSVSISSDGTRVAIGAPYNDGNGGDAGHVRVFDWPMIRSKKILKDDIVEVGGELTVSGNATVSSNLTVSGNATVSSNLTVSGNATVSSNLTVSGNATVSSNLTVSGDATVSSNLTVAGHIHQEDGRWKFDFENRRPERLTPTTEFRYVVVEGTSDLPVSTNAKYAIPDSGTTVYQYVPSTDTTTTLISSTSAADTVGSIALTTGTEIYTTSAKPFVLTIPGYNYAVIPFVCKGYYLGYTNNRYRPTVVYLYAPYEDVTVNLYLDKAITETPTETFTLTKQTVTTRSIDPGADNYSYTIEAVNGVIMASKSGDSSIGTDPTEPDGDHEILYPASTLGYNMTTSSGSYYNHDVFSTGGGSSDEGSVHRFSSDVIQNGPTFYSPSGIPHFSSVGGDGDGGDTTGIIPHEIVGEIYYIPHIIPGYMIGFLTNRQTVTSEYYHGGQWYTDTAHNAPKSGVSAYNAIPKRVWQVGAKLDGNRSNLSGNMASSTLWRFTSDHPFVLRVESEDNVASSWDEYMAVGWLNPTRTTPIYKPPCFTTPVIYEANLNSGVNINAGANDAWIEYNIFEADNVPVNRAYGGGFSARSGGQRIIVPAPGFYRCTATVYLYRSDAVASRTSTEVRFSAKNGTGSGPIGEGYIRLYDGHDHVSIAITTIVDLTNVDWNVTSTECPPHIGLLFRRAGTITEAVYTDGTSKVLLELIR
jgi:hypothetical protein